MLAAAAAVIAGAGGYLACAAQSDEPDDPSGQLSVDVHSAFDLPLRDIPSQRPTALIVDFAGIDVHHRTEGWIELGGGGIFNLLDPNPNLQRIFGTTRLPDGMYDEIRFQIRVALVQVDRKWYEVEVPSGEESGLKIHTTFCMVAGDPENLHIEVDVDESLHYNEQRGYWLTPSISVVSTPSCTDDLATPPPRAPERPMHG
jgi:hypothetical protein